MIDCSVCYHTQGGKTDPFPIDDIFVHRGGLKLDFLAKIKNLKRPLICFECDGLAVPVHDGTVGFDRPPRDFIVVFEIDDDDLGVGVLA